MEKSEVPEYWVISNVVHIFKKDEKCKVEIYCPVRLTSQLSKVLESIIKDEIMAHLKKHNLIRLSTRFYAKEMMLSWKKQVDKGHPVNIIYMDFAKAFDMVHRRLLEKLKAHGIGPKLIKWIEAWLCNRKQRLVLKGKQSSWKAVLSGVPQGSVLSGVPQGSVLCGVPQGSVLSGVPQGSVLSGVPQGWVLK